MEDVWTRQNGLIHPDKLHMPILIIGAGSIGSWTALALAKLGCSHIVVMDGDIAETHNAGSQLYKASDHGESKVKMLTEKLSLLTEFPVVGIPHHWNHEDKEDLQELTNYPIIISAVDNITVRKNLFEALKGQESLYIDGRMAGNALEIYTSWMNNEKDCELYEKTLFTEGEELPIACSEKSVVYNVFIVAGLITDIVAKAANEQGLPKELIVDLYNFSLFK